MPIGKRTITDLIELTPKQFKILKYNQFYRNQKQRCAVLKYRIDYKSAVFDHKHRTKDELIGIDDKGLLRGVIHKEVNRFEGKVLQFYKRYGLEKLIDLPLLLRNLADYLEHPPMEPKYIHPSELPKRAKLSKREYKRVCKYYFKVYPNRRKLPKFPDPKKSIGISAKWKKYIEDVDQYIINNTR